MATHNFRIAEWFPALDATQLKLLKSYHGDLLKWTKTINLISPGTVENSDRVHIADSLLGVELLTSQINKSGEIFDFGSGNGLPGIIIGLLYPELRVICVDSDQRKCAFIKQWCLRHSIRNIEVRLSRVEDLEFTRPFSAVTRGLGDLGKVLELANSQSVTGTSIFHFKGPDWKRELEGWGEVRPTEWEIGWVGDYKLPVIEDEGGEVRTIIKTVKT